jgi:hypothetical protein
LILAKKKLNIYSLIILFSGLLIESYGYLIGITTSILIVNHYLGGSPLFFFLYALLVMFFFIRTWSIHTNKRKKEWNETGITKYSIAPIYIQPIYFLLIITFTILNLVNLNLEATHLGWAYGFVKDYLP